MAKHQVIYGPTEYSESAHFTYVMADLGSRLGRTPCSRTAISAAGADAKAQYAAHREQFLAATSYRAVAAQAKQRLLDQTFNAYLTATP